jgi:hypothetical protein
VCARASQISESIYESIIGNKDKLDSILSTIDFSKTEELLKQNLPKAEGVDEPTDFIYDSRRNARAAYHFLRLVNDGLQKQMECLGL